MNSEIAKQRLSEVVRIDTITSSYGWFMGFTPSLVSGCWVGGEERDIHFDTMLHEIGRASCRERV